MEAAEEDVAVGAAFQIVWSAPRHSRSTHHLFGTDAEMESWVETGDEAGRTLADWAVEMQQYGLYSRKLRALWYLRLVIVAVPMALMVADKLLVFSVGALLLQLTLEVSPSIVRTMLAVLAGNPRAHLTELQGKQPVCTAHAVNAHEERAH